MPARPLEITGLRFSHLVALWPVARQCRSIVWLFQCDCGQFKALRAANVTRKDPRSKTCGCQKSEGIKIAVAVSAAKRFKDLTGAKRGRLKVLEYLGRKKNPSGSITHYYRCRCKCGNEKTVTGDSLRHWRTQSCGCLRAENNTKLMNKARQSRWKKEDHVACEHHGIQVEYFGARTATPQEAA